MPEYKRIILTNKRGQAFADVCGQCGKEGRYGPNPGLGATDLYTCHICACRFHEKCRASRLFMASVLVKDDDEPELFDAGPTWICICEYCDHEEL